MALQATTVATAIAGLTITGMKPIRDLDQIPDEVQGRECPILYPRPDNWLTNLRVVRDSYGLPSVAKWTVQYTLNYMFLYEPIAADRKLFVVYKLMVAQALLILDKLIASDWLSGAVDLAPRDIPAFDPVMDPAGRWFHGCVISIDVTEFVN